MSNWHHEQVRSVLDDLEQNQSKQARHDRMFTEIIETGGHWITPNNCGPEKSTHMVEIHLHDILGQGATDEEAIRNWMLVASKIISPEVLAS